jgi:hypothetical protein
MCAVPEPAATALWAPASRRMALLTACPEARASTRLFQLMGDPWARDAVSGASAPDLGLGVNPLRGVEVLPDPRVVAKQRGRAIAELICDVLRRMTFVDKRRREARAQVARADAAWTVVSPLGQPSAVRGAAECAGAPLVPVGTRPGLSACVCDHRRVVEPGATGGSPGLEIPGERREQARRTLVHHAAFRGAKEDRPSADGSPGQRECVRLRPWAGVGKQADERRRTPIVAFEAPCAHRFDLIHRDDHRFARALLRGLVDRLYRVACQVVVTDPRAS